MDRDTAPHRIRSSDVAGKRRIAFRLTPKAEDRAALAAELGISAVGKLDFEGALSPLGRSDVALEGRLKASVTQPCVVTLAPVTTKIDEPVARRYLAEMPEPEGEEVEMPEDETAEPLPQVIDLAEVMAEALALTLPLYPRAPGAELGPEAGESVAEERNRPFAGLKGLLDGNSGGEGGGEGGKEG
ncbi:YceD family protein [Solirhodobacter olei]|uniref:YceD family protein n=1 Tax=Solirhodobacter olei TaxID=2493082 RepID=UPI000FD8B477|nr:DUF177 domain-containing protein [Solirhodobacter olei]